MAGLIKFRQINCNHSIAAAAKIVTDISVLDSFMYLVQEPYTVHGKLKDAPRGCNIYKGEELGVRAAIYCSRNIKSAFVGKYSD